MKKIPGDPLTGQLPKTMMVIRPQRSSVALDVWPLRPDVDSVTLRLLETGNIAAVRTRRGVRTVLIRVVRPATNRRGKGRRFIIGSTRRGWCRPYWVSSIISIERRRKWATSMGTASIAR